MKKRKCLKLWVSTLAIAMLLTGCGATANDMAVNSSSMKTEMMVEQDVSMEAGFDSAGVLYDSMDYEMAVEESTGEIMQETDAVVSDSKMITTVDMTVETKEFDQLLAALETGVKELGGYIESMETYNGSAYSGYRSSRNASMTIRIPQDRLDGFLSEVSDICNVIRRSKNEKNVTLTYVDLESHKKVLQAEQERLLELIERAENIDEIITIESRLSDVRYQLESMESQLRTLDNKINYSTIELYIEEVRELTPVEEKTTPERIADGFLESLEDIGNGMKEFGIWFVVNIPYFVLWIIIILVVVLIIKWLIKFLGKNKSDGKKVRNQNGQTEMTGTVNETERK